ncbi:formyltransferase family protein [Blattabacterium cuenoti]|uniref:formyltransferase family protein n=1 Tax=Blattabacterium cuenoti TaxID=1653831 RepID=UPI001EE9E16D|nr:formyltransferase family protein [Blattabacterium cuenoti]
MIKKIAILVSGNGTNMKHILHSINNGYLSNFKIDLVISDRKCKAIQFSIQNGINSFCLKKNKFLSHNIDKILIKYNPYIVILSGFLSILNENFCKKWINKVINIHPSLLPKYGGIGMYGNKVHKLVIKNKDKISGATVHYVTKDIDLGDIIIKKSCKISSIETINSLSNKVSMIEKKILIESIKNL